MDVRLKSRSHVRTEQDRMKLFAGLTVTGIVGFFLLEILKIILAPVSAWLIAMLGALAALLMKVLMVGVIAGFLVVALVVGVWVYRRSRRAEA